MKILKVIALIILTTTLLTACDSDGNFTQSDFDKVEQGLETLTKHLQQDSDDTSKPEVTKADIDLINANTNSENYAYINDNKTNLTTADNKLLDKYSREKFWVIYPKLDQYGRAGTVTALVTQQSVESHSSKVRKRPAFDYGVHIAGEYKDGVYNPEKQAWKGEESNNEILQLNGYRGYIYNKSHSLAWSLGGDMETHNLTLGTRAQNVGTNRDRNGGGMGYAETQIRNAIHEHPQTKVYYKVTPVYQGSELLPRGSHVRAYSVNDDGQTVNINVWVSNTQKGVKINYQNGTHNG
ncbi:DNA/RNA non-specific endonuclease [Staphylococcus gallinarum]|jgi:DNA-entry nuclease|uniref:DNA/RNA non-specific endonuclease n=1 Tax=Staphylococcus gallinarum TaxID=1293 RepID=UPI001E3EF8A2|nr:DNA/RNA non-specific endonuclease [Staphylococcus gallinarum]MCD8843865.1 DNA/RNA non-specific endonuclease [Staphylococcus gallinarum]